MLLLYLRQQQKNLHILPWVREGVHHVEDDNQEEVAGMRRHEEIHDEMIDHLLHVEGVNCMDHHDLEDHPDQDPHHHEEVMVDHNNNKDHLHHQHNSIYHLHLLEKK
mmetsp:Transcript_535/g.1965  ORF Transcript_535/g.1965 Transcript_535/m.1965 type:complete len:107 (-) Transcript_535:81-401(-)